MLNNSLQPCCCIECIVHQPHFHAVALHSEIQRNRIPLEQDYHSLERKQKYGSPGKRHIKPFLLTAESSILVYWERRTLSDLP